MLRKFIWILVIALAAILFLAACERSAVTPKTDLTPASGTSQATIALPDAYKTQTTSGAYTALALTMQPGIPVSTGETPIGTSYWDSTISPTFGFPVPTVTGAVSTLLAPTSTPGIPDTYTLQKGEFPYCIARRFDVDLDELLTLNSLPKVGLYPEGLVLKIPKTGNPFGEPRALKPHPTTYTVAVGDTIYSVACAFGDVDPIYLAAYNSIMSPYILTTGTILNIP